MKKWLIPVGIIVILVIMAVSSYNGLVGVQADAKTAWSNVESSYQRRNDLIGNLVKTVQGAADFEKGTLTAVIEARAKATSMTIDPTNISPEQMAQFQQTQDGLAGALKSLLVTVERYPDLKANEGSDFFDWMQSKGGLNNVRNNINSVASLHLGLLPILMNSNYPNTVKFKEAYDKAIKFTDPKLKENMLVKTNNLNALEKGYNLITQMSA
jgi:LemA protein